MGRREKARFLVSLVLAVLVLGGFSLPLGSLPSLGSLLDPTAGLWTVPTHARFPAHEDVIVEGLSATATVVRDLHGVPHIYAARGEDGWFALGYVHAQDRLWQMDIQHRAAAGRLSEVLGPDFLETDIFFRTIGLNRIAAKAIQERGDPDAVDVAVLDAYAAGVNAVISRTSAADLPFEFKLLDYAPEPWSPEKTVCVGLLTAYGLAGSFADLEYALLVDAFNGTAAEALFPVYPAARQIPIEPGSGARPSSIAPSAPGSVSPIAARDILAKARRAAAVLPQFVGAGSNNWAVAGNRSMTGEPLLAADPHLGFQLPAVWYWAELQAPPYHVRGATFPGIPGFFFGTNGRIAWGETNTGADVNDFYVETFSPDGDQYLFRGEWRNVTVHRESVRVKGGGIHDLDVVETIHGPVITTLDQTVAMRSTLSQSRGEFKAILLINLAQDWTDFRDALRSWLVPAQNFIYGDIEGNIGIRSNGQYPIRNRTTPQNALARVPLNGSSGDFEWIGEVPFDDYPEAFNPPQGFVSSTNQVPAGPAYPYYLGTFWDEGYRARRIHDLLASDSSVSFEELRRFQRDVYDVSAEALVPVLLAAAAPRDDRDRAALLALASWNREMTVDTIAGTVFRAFINEFREATFGDEYSAQGATDLSLPQFHTLEAFVGAEPGSVWFDDVSTLSVREALDDILRAAFARTMDSLASEMGPDLSTWTWGRRHVRQFDHLTALAPLGRGPYPSEGDGFTLNPAGGLVAKHGPSWRQLIDFSNMNGSLAIYPGGQSGNPTSLHYDDFLPLFLAADYLPFPARGSISDIAAGDVESTLRLVPR